MKKKPGLQITGLRKKTITRLQVAGVLGEKKRWITDYTITKKTNLLGYRLQDYEVKKQTWVTDYTITLTYG